MEEYVHQQVRVALEYKRGRMSFSEALHELSKIDSKYMCENHISQSFRWYFDCETYAKILLTNHTTREHFEPVFKKLWNRREKNMEKCDKPID